MLGFRAGVLFPDEDSSWDGEGKQATWDLGALFLRLRTLFALGKLIHGMAFGLPEQG